MWKKLQEIAQTGMLFGAICIAPRILAHAHVLSGKKATGWNHDQKLQDIFANAGAVYVAQPCVVDGNIITADGPKSAEIFSERIIEFLQKK